MKDIYFSDLTMEELETLCRDANNELTRRKKQEQKEDWDKVVATLKSYIKKYGDIEISTSEDPDDDILINEQIIYPEPGKMRPLCY